MARIVESDVQAAEPLDAGVQRRLDVVLTRDIAADGERLTAALLDQARRLLVAVSGDVGDHHACTFAGERKRGGAADAARRAGDERDLPVEPAAHGVTMTLIASRSAISRYSPFMTLVTCDPTSSTTPMASWPIDCPVSERA
jgi:hypothetical protein